jgi:hypothetical protein
LHAATPCASAGFALVLEFVLLLAACVLVELAAGVLAVLEDELLLLLLLPQPANAIVPATAINAHSVLIMRPPQVDERPASRPERQRGQP